MMINPLSQLVYVEKFENAAKAKAYFEKALALDSSFVLARQNLEAMRSLESGGKNVQPVMGQPGASPANKEN